MIKNDKQLKITKDALEDFLEAIRHYDKKAETEKVGPTLAKAMLGALESEVEVLTDQIEEYLTEQLIELIPELTKGHDNTWHTNCSHCRARQLWQQLQ